MHSTRKAQYFEDQSPLAEVMPEHWVIAILMIGRNIRTLGNQVAITQYLGSGHDDA